MVVAYVRPYARIRPGNELGSGGNPRLLAGKIITIKALAKKFFKNDFYSAKLYIVGSFKREEKKSFLALVDNVRIT